MNRIMVVDGNPLLYRADMVLDLTDPSGRRVSGIYGTLELLQLAVETMDPTHVFVCWDSPAKTLYRKRLFSGYKSRRKPKDEADRLRKQERYRQIGECEEILRRMPIYQLRWVGMEADDLAYYIVNRFPLKEKSNFVLVTVDHDWLQLLSKNVQVLLTHTNTLVTLDNYRKFAADSKKLAGVRQDRLPLFMSLKGDSGDDVPGIFRVGPKTAARWANRYDNINDLANHEPIVRSNLSVCNMARMLTDLSLFPYTDDLDSVLHHYSKPEIDWNWVRQYFIERRFVSMLTRFKFWVSAFRGLEDANPL